jgi:hypothetical protein
MFTITQIEEVHSRVNSGADFPKYVKELMKLGVTSYTTYVDNGHTEYNGINHTLPSSRREDAVLVVFKKTMLKSLSTISKITRLEKLIILLSADILRNPASKDGRSIWKL